MRGEALAHVQAKIAPNGLRRPPFINSHMLKGASFLELFWRHRGVIRFPTFELFESNILVGHNLNNIPLDVGRAVIPIIGIGFKNSMLVTLPLDQFIRPGNNRGIIDLRIISPGQLQSSFSQMCLGKGVINSEILTKAGA